MHLGRIGARVGARVGITAAMLALAALFFVLGQWQLQRAAESRGRLERLASTATEPPLNEPVEDQATDTLRYRRLQLRGRYEPDLQFLLDNMVHRGEVGYQVLTPFRPTGEDRWLLVNRGWVKASPDRSVLPDVRVDVEPRDLAGRIDSLPRPGLLLGGSSVDREQPGVLVVLYPTAAELASLLGHTIFDYQILLDAAQRDGYVREWQAGGMAPERHLMYAGQWFLFAVGAAAVALVIGARLLIARSRS